MTSDEAASVIAGREGRLCARLFRRADGTVITADCRAITVEAEPIARPKSPYRRTHALAMILVAVVLAWMGNTKGEAPPSRSGVTFDDWVHWVAVSLGLRPAPSPAPVFSPTATISDVYYSNSHLATVRRAFVGPLCAPGHDMRTCSQGARECSSRGGPE
jgi:hypothetical protein